jgi:hypothetical protein
MHTAICAFDDAARAEEALAALLRAGFARHDVHIEHRELYADSGTQARRGGDPSRKARADRGVLSSFGHFFTSLLGRDDPSGRADTYEQHVERGCYVVVADAGDAAGAERARTMMQQMRARDAHTVYRPERHRLRDIVGVGDESVDDGTAGMVERNREPYEGWTPSAMPNLAADAHATSSHTLSPTGGPDLREPDVGRAPGLRYADKDKPNG